MVAAWFSVDVLCSLQLLSPLASTLAGRAERWVCAELKVFLLGYRCVASARFVGPVRRECQRRWLARRRLDVYCPPLIPIAPQDRDFSN